MPPPSRRARAILAASAVALLAAAVWLGGLLVLGALVAPVVFGVVPAPSSADAMTIVFRRFDSVEMTVAMVLVSVELARAVLTRGRRLADWLRIAVTLALAAGSAWQGMSLSPGIEALHRGGAIRGLGEEGLRLESLHRLAEANAKIELVLLVLLVALHALAAAHVQRDGDTSR
jgi:hypothetical protein